MMTEYEIERAREQHRRAKGHAKYRREVNLANDKAKKYYRAMMQERKENEEYRRILREIPRNYSL